MCAKWFLQFSDHLFERCWGKVILFAQQHWDNNQFTNISNPFSAKYFQPNYLAAAFRKPPLDNPSIFNGISVSILEPKHTTCFAFYALIELKHVRAAMLCIWRSAVSIYMRVTFPALMCVCVWTISMCGPRGNTNGNHLRRELDRKWDVWRRRSAAWIYRYIVSVAIAICDGDVFVYLL